MYICYKPSLYHTRKKKFIVQKLGERISQIWIKDAKAVSFQSLLVFS